MKEYRIKVTVRNNLLLSAIEDAGYKTQAEFARAIDLHVGDVNSLVALRSAPINSDGEFTRIAKAIMEALGACPTDLWSEEQLTMQLRKNTSEKELSREAMIMALEGNCQNLIEFESADELMEKDDFKRLVNDCLNSLSPREAKVLRLRFGLDSENERTLDEVGNIFKMTKEAIRQIEAKALRKMRVQARSEPLTPYLD